MTMFSCCYHKRGKWQDMTSFHIDYADKTSAVSVHSSKFLFPSFHRVPVLTTSITDLQRLPKMSPKISILYSVSSVRSVMSVLRSSPPSTSSLGCPGPSAWLTIMTKVSRASSSATQASLKLSGVTSETRRACTSGSASEWQGKVSFAPLWNWRVLWHLKNMAAKESVSVYVQMPALVIWKLSISQQIKSLSLQSRKIRVLLQSDEKHRRKKWTSDNRGVGWAKQKHPTAFLVNWPVKTNVVSMMKNCFSQDCDDFQEILVKEYISLM